MKRGGPLQVAGLGLLFGAIAYLWLSLAPGAPPLTYIVNPAYFALVVATLVAPTYGVLTMLPRRKPHLEALLLAIFLAGMPAVYLCGALLNHNHGGILLESVGLVVYGAWAIVGYRRSMLLLGIGIAAHGFAWDAWHYGRTSYIHPFYPLGCFVVDIAFGLAIAAQVVGRQPPGNSSVSPRPPSLS